MILKIILCTALQWFALSFARWSGKQGDASPPYPILIAVGLSIIMLAVAIS